VGTVDCVRVWSAEDQDSDEDDDDDDEDDEVSEESEESEEGEGEDREVYDVDVCPAGCSIALYNRMCNEREKRVDIEEVIASERTVRDAIIKDLEQGKKRAKIVVDLVEEAEEELEAFQVSFQLVAWRSGRTLVFDQRTFPDLRSTYS